MRRITFLTTHIVALALFACFCMADNPTQVDSLLPPDWSPVLAGNEVLERLTPVTAPHVQGAHDAQMVLKGNRAYIVALINEEGPGESAHWLHIYVAMSIVNLDTREVEQIIPFARGGQVFENEMLPEGSCFVPRIIQKDDDTLRCYFASQQPGVRQAQTWYRDFDIPSQSFENRIYRVKLKTADGVFDMQPQYFHADAVRHGFERNPVDYGLYLFDSFRFLDGKVYVAINNFRGRQNALAVANDALDTFEVLGHINEPQRLAMSEAAINRLPDGTWMAILRTQAGQRNYAFSESIDGRTWSVAESRDFVPNGTSSKPTFDKFNGIYYLGWQESTEIDDVYRSVFNVDVSRDGRNWERKYRFETTHSFQYPSFHEHNGHIWVCVTQGDHSRSRKERIMFGKLE